MSASLHLLLMHPAFGQITPLHGITQALDIIAAAAITTAAAVVNGDHIIPEEVVFTADAKELLQEEVPFPQLITIMIISTPPPSVMMAPKASILPPE